MAAMSAAVEHVNVAAYSIPTDAPESDGTYEWDRTVLVVVEVRCAGHTGLGYTYADASTARLIHDHLAPLLFQHDPVNIPALWIAMGCKVRNLGRPGIASMAISAVDVALWDLKAKLHDQPLYALLGAARDAVPVYGSGGFTSYSPKQLRDQLGGWAREGIPRVKMKVGRNPDQDIERARIARDAIGPDVALYVDANGAYSRKQALAFAEKYAELGVVWFEEPVSADDLEGLHLIRDRAPAGMAIAAGEYGYQPLYFRRMLEAGAVDVMQADATRCGGVTGLLKAAYLAEAFELPISTHCAPALHLHPCLALTTTIRPMEYFHDHVRIEAMLFDGTVKPIGGALHADPGRPGMGLTFKHADAAKYKIWDAQQGDRTKPA
jgi:L-alanine-DL-glutamate epimerase-like enolase superfamily enzyme